MSSLAISPGTSTTQPRSVLFGIIVLMQPFVSCTMITSFTVAFQCFCANFWERSVNRRASSSLSLKKLAGAAWAPGRISDVYSCRPIPSKICRSVSLQQSRAMPDSCCAAIFVKRRSSSRRSLSSANDIEQDCRLLCSHSPHS